MFCGGCGNNIGDSETCQNCGWTASGKKITDKKEEDSSGGSVFWGIVVLVAVILILRTCIGC